MPVSAYNFLTASATSEDAGETSFTLRFASQIRNKFSAGMMDSCFEERVWASLKICYAPTLGVWEKPTIWSSSRRLRGRSALYFKISRGRKGSCPPILLFSVPQALLCRNSPSCSCDLTSSVTVPSIPSMLPKTRHLNFPLDLRMLSTSARHDEALRPL